MTPAPTGTANPPASRWAAPLRVIAAGVLAGGLLWFESGRGDSRLPRWDDAALAALQSFLPGDGHGPLVLESSPDIDTRVFAPRVRPGGLPVTLLSFESKDASILVTWPPGPVDVAVLLSALEKSGARGIALAQPPVWPAPEEGTLATRALGGTRAALGATAFAAACEPGFSAAPPDEAAARLATLPSLSIANVHGDARQLPEVNDPGPRPGAGTGLTSTDLAFSRLLTLDTPPALPGRVALPMLARAGDRVLPALPLLLMARALGEDIAHADVRLGQAILLGKLAIPVDARGFLHLPASHLGRTSRLSPLDLAKAGPDEPIMSSLKDKFVVIGHDALPKPGDGSATTADWTAAALGAMASGDYGLPVRVLKRAPAVSTLALCVVFTLGAAMVLPLRRPLRLAAAIAMGLLYLAATRHAAAALDLFHGMTLPAGLFLAVFATSLWQPAPAPVTSSAEPARAPEPTSGASHPDAVTPDSPALPEPIIALPGSGTEPIPSHAAETPDASPAEAKSAVEEAVPLDALAPDNIAPLDATAEDTATENAPPPEPELFPADVPRTGVTAKTRQRGQTPAPWQRQSQGPAEGVAVEARHNQHSVRLCFTKELFRLVQGRIIPRVAIETIAHQKDPWLVHDTRENHCLPKESLSWVIRGMNPRLRPNWASPSPAKAK